MLFNMFLEQIMQYALQNHKLTIYLGGREISNLIFTDDIEFITGSNDELQELTNIIVKVSKEYEMEVSKEKK